MYSGNGEVEYTHRRAHPVPIFFVDDSHNASGILE